MELIRVDLQNPETWNPVFARVKEALANNGTVLLPTDTIYGLSANALSEVAAQKIFLVKRRETRKALPVFVRDISQARSIAAINKAQESFLKKTWPGKVTVVLKRRQELPVCVSGDGKTVGLRQPSLVFLLTLMEKISFPIIGTSANISGKDPFRNGASALSFFKGETFQPDLIVDAGELPDSRPSTVVDLTALKIIREGAVERTRIFDCWDECVSNKVTK